MRHVYEAIADELHAEGVRIAFGLMGDDGAAMVTAFAAGDGARYVGARHENAAVNLAEGYAWASDGLGVGVISRGPGTTNAMTALATVARNGSRVLVLSGDAPIDGSAPGPDLKRADAAALAAAAGIGFHTATTAADVPHRLREAIDAAWAGRPALFALPADLMYHPAQPVQRRDGARPARRGPEPSDAELDRALELIAASHRPLILAGRGALGAQVGSRLEALAARIGALLGTTLPAKGLFAGHRLDVGVVGGFATAAARNALERVDCVLAFGASLTSYTTIGHRLFAGLPVVQFDRERDRLGRNHPIAAGVEADAGRAAERLLAAVPERSEGDRPLHDPSLLGSLTSRPAAEPAGAPVPGWVDPQRLVGIFDAALPADRAVVIDAGHMMGFPAQHISLPGPGRLCLTTPFGSVGMGLGTAIGAALARPDRQTVLFIGDGGLSMTLGELDTLARSGAPLIVVVLDDEAYGAERHFLDVMGLPNDAARFGDVDFAGVAAALGIESATVRSLDDLDADLLSAPRSSPLLLACKIDPTLRAAWFDELEA